MGRVLAAAPESPPLPVTAVRAKPLRDNQMVGKGAAIWRMRLLDRLEINGG